jgi:hypothetical protein
MQHYDYIFCMRLCKCIWQIFTLASCNVSEIFKICKCESFINRLQTQHWYVHRFFRDQLEKNQQTSPVRQVKSLYYILKYLEGSPTKTFPIVLEISPTNTFPIVLETSPTIQLVMVPGRLRNFWKTFGYQCWDVDTRSGHRVRGSWVVGMYQSICIIWELGVWGPIRIGRGKSISKVIGRQPACNMIHNIVVPFLAIIELFF